MKLTYKAPFTHAVEMHSEDTILAGSLTISETGTSKQLSSHNNYSSFETNEEQDDLN